MRRQESEVRRQETDTPRHALASWGAWLFIAVALLLAPLFAHGCHGDDVDHEPLLIPSRLNPDDS